MSGVKAGLIAAALASLSACALPALPPPQASLDNIQAARASGMAPVAVGDFVAAAGEPSEMDRSIAVRAGVQSAPGGSFARYLGQTLATELKGSGKLDPASALIVSGVVTHTHVDSNIGTGHAALSARFKLTRNGATVFEKSLDASATWYSDFMGAVAIPDAFNHYVGLFPKLVGELLADPDFRAAARPAPTAPAP